MKISLVDLGKRFNTEWIFKNLNFEFEAGKSYAITGPNGSGKSTLLQIISGYTLPSSGKVVYEQNNDIIEADEIFRHIGISAPYLELIEEFTLYELLKFHFSFKMSINNMTINDIIDESYLNEATQKVIGHFSSGMKQRLKLALSIFTDNKIILLDEPTANFDEKAVNWYQDQIKRTRADGRVIIIASNQKQEYEFCEEVIRVADYK